MSVVIAYSPSAQGQAALRAGALEASARELPLVVAAHSYVDSSQGRTTADEKRVREELAELGAPRVQVRFRSSDDADVAGFLLELAERENAELLVIGLRGKSRIGKLSLGATARRVILASPCPVLAVRETDPAV